MTPAGIRPSQSPAQVIHVTHCQDSVDKVVLGGISGAIYIETDSSKNENCLQGKEAWCCCAMVAAAPW